MIALASLEVSDSFFNITEQINTFELYKLPDSKSGGISYQKVRGDIERDLKISPITATDPQDEMKGPIILEEYREKKSETRKNDENMKFLAGYIRSIFQDFESYLRTEVDLVENDIILALDEYNSSFFTHE